MNAFRPSSLALTLILTLSLATGCGSSRSKSSSTKTSQTTTPAQSSTTAKPIANPFKKPATPAHRGQLEQLATKDVVKGKGAVLNAGDTGIFDYVGADYRTGKVFDSSWSRHQPLRIAIDNGGVIAGWWQGLPGMRVGGRRILMIPSSLGYGAQGSPPAIKPNEPLFFVVDLLGVVPAQPGGSGSGATAPQG